MMRIKVPMNMRKGPHMHTWMQKQPRILKPTVEVEILLPAPNMEGMDIYHQTVPTPLHKMTSLLDPVQQQDMIPETQE